MVLPDAVGAFAVGVRGGRIVDVRPWDPDAAPAEGPGADGAPVTDAGRRWLLPGLVDTHVHLNDPGRTEWEGIASGTRAAAAGGVTTLVDMPLNSIPPTVSPAALEAKRVAARGRCMVDLGFCGGLVPDNAAEVGRLRDAGVVAVKCFLAPSGVDEFPHVDATSLARGLANLAAVGLPLLVHAELPGPLVDPPVGDPQAYDTWLRARPDASEVEAVALLLDLCRAHDARAHVVHLSSADALPTLARAREEDVALSAETCPHYLSFAAETIARGATAWKCAPPIRSAANRDRLWEALRSGLLDMVVTDHSPAPGALKCIDSGDFARAWGGIASLQLGLAATWTEARLRGFTVPELVRRMSAVPARLVGLEGRKGSIRVGLDADLVVWDDDAPFVVDPVHLQHRHPVTPYAGRLLRGRVVETWVRGRRVYDGTGFAEPEGELVGERS